MLSTGSKLNIVFSDDLQHIIGVQKIALKGVVKYKLLNGRGSKPRWFSELLNYIVLPYIFQTPNFDGMIS